MFDPDTSDFIRRTPPLEGLDRQSLPELLTNAFLQISSARIRLRDLGDGEPEDLTELIDQIRRLSYTNEALLSVLPERDDRSAVAYVGATAHQLCLNADLLFRNDPSQTYLGIHSISSDISAMLLFMIAEATASASEISKRLSWQSDDPIEVALITSLQDLARGKLSTLTSRAIPDPSAVASDEPATSATRALYREMLEGVHALSNRILQGQSTSNEYDPISIFQRICALSIDETQEASEHSLGSSPSAFPGPYHLASLLIAVSKDLEDSAVSNVPSPPGIDDQRWNRSMRSIATARPFLWRNHRRAIKEGYLQQGVSAAVSFPTGAGKSTLAELKINVALLSEKAVIFLSPTHALVDQTAKSLSGAFPTASVQGERLDEFGFITGDDELPEILVMTPESCLTKMSIDASAFENVGLFVFDECHLLHPNESTRDRRAIDAMLCVLNLSKIAVDADFLFMSAMMKNTDDVAGWIAELTGRPCRALKLSWKPTQQLRGSVVYCQDRITQLQRNLTYAKGVTTTLNPTASLKRSLTAQPLALFSMKQTWATRNREDYALVSLLDKTVTLRAGSRWNLTPNAIKVSSSIAVASVETGVKTLVFFQTIKNAVSAASQIAKLLPTVSIQLQEDEAHWLDVAITELGDASHTFLKVEDGYMIEPVTVHHGLLLPEERYLCESLYKRADGIKVLTATSTLAQGMNLPSELVIIGEDSRFDQTSGRRDILQAQELLNAAGRAGRAGESSSGVVLVVPGKVIGIDLDEAPIGSHWSDLRKIFGQSDQCLDIDDPLTAVLDRIYSESEDLGEIERYTITRLASNPHGTADSSTLENTIQSSFAAYKATQRNDSDWLDGRIDTATTFFQGQSPESESELAEIQVAASLGLSLDLVSRLAESLEDDGPTSSSTVPIWRRWFFRWLSDNPDLLEQTFRQQSLTELFGRSYKALVTDKDKATSALPILKRLTCLWMRGDALCELEEAFGTASNGLETCNKARRFVLRLVPELSYLFSLPALLHQRKHIGSEDPEEPSPVLSQLAGCVRNGFNSHEKAALNAISTGTRFSRRQIHQHFDLIRPHLTPAPSGETWEKTLVRVEDARDRELNSRGINY